MSVKFTDNSREVLSAFEEAEARGLERIGLVAEGYAKDLCSVDTGNLYNSISHLVDEDSAYIGTNVEYAPDVELGTVKQEAQPYLKPAVADHAQTYRNIMEDELKNG
jgi:phage gpG-like protein